MGIMKGMKASNNSGGGSEIAPAGPHAAVLVAIVDLGAQPNDWQGNITYRRTVLLAWELTGEKMSGSQFNHVITRDYYASLAKRANLRQLIESWRGRDMSDGEAFDLSVMLGKACLLTIKHGKTRNDKSFAKVDAVAGLGKLPAGQATRTPFLWEYDPDGEEYPDPDWIPWLYGRPVKEVIAEGIKNLTRHAEGDANEGDEGGGADEPATADETIPF